MKSNIDKYTKAFIDDSYDLNDKLNYAEDLVKQAEGIIEIEKRPEILKEIIDLDLRENVPPQIYEIISCVIDVIVKVER